MIIIIVLRENNGRAVESQGFGGKRVDCAFQVQGEGCSGRRFNVLVSQHLHPVKGEMRININAKVVQPRAHPSQRSRSALTGRPPFALGSYYSCRLISEPQAGHLCNLNQVNSERMDKPHGWYALAPTRFPTGPKRRCGGGLPSIGGASVGSRQVAGTTGVRSFGFHVDEAYDPSFLDLLERYVALAGLPAR